MDKIAGTPGKPIRLLFIGNSATYVHDIPQTLSVLAGQAGYSVETKAIARGGFRLSQHADAATEHGKAVLCEIESGYDAVILQDNGNCISSDAMRAAATDACKTLDSAIRAAGSATYIYVRPPYGKDSAEYTPFAQCVEFDSLFGEIAKQIGAVNVYVNRAFAYAMTHLPYDLWGPDHAHTSVHGGYLTVCVFFATLFHTSSAVLAPNGLPPEEALALQKAADRIVLDGYCFSE